MLNIKNNKSVWSIFLVFLRLGLTSFGGPVAHLAYFRDEFVARREWLTERSYADLVALCQFLPGPASSQVGMALGMSRSGYAGGLAAWAGFTLPSAIALILFALGLSHYGDIVPAGVLHGLKVVAVAVVMQAVWGMGRKLCNDLPRISIMVVATCCVLFFPFVWGQVGVIALAAIAGLLIFKPEQQSTEEAVEPLMLRRDVGLICLILFFVLLISLPIVSGLFPSSAFEKVDAFYRSGALVFGGGHVVLPLLQAEVVPSGWVSEETFLAGYGAAQAVPGPLFTFAAFLGASMPTGIQNPPGGWSGGILCLLAIFAPSFLLLAGTLPFWEKLRKNTRAQAALSGVNAAVVGLLLAALYQPVWTSAIHGPKDFGLALIALIALMYWKIPPWLVVIGSGMLGALLALF